MSTNREYHQQYLGNLDDNTIHEHIAIAYKNESWGYHEALELELYQRYEKRAAANVRKNLDYLPMLEKLDHNYISAQQIEHELLWRLVSFMTDAQVRAFARKLDLERQAFEHPDATGHETWHTMKVAVCAKFQGMTEHRRKNR